MDYRTAEEKIYSIQVIGRDIESRSIKNCSDHRMYNQIVDEVYRPLSMSVKGCERMIKENE